MCDYCVGDIDTSPGDSSMNMLRQFATRRGTTPEALIERANNWKPPPRKPTVDERLARLKWL